MKYLYKVELEAKWTGMKDWCNETVRVLAGDDAEAAARKAKRYQLGQTFVDDLDGRGKVTRRCTAVRLSEVSMISSVDVG